VTDFKVHHGDLIASTMGRSFWIHGRHLNRCVSWRRARDEADDASASDERRRFPRSRWTSCPARPVAQAFGLLGRRPRVDATARGLDASAEQPRAAESPPAPTAVRSCSRGCRRLLDHGGAESSPFDGSNVFLFTPGACVSHALQRGGRPS